MKYKVEIWVSHNYGGWTIQYAKQFELPFPPFYGMWITESNEKHENSIRLDTNGYQLTIINYDVNENKFDITIREYWKQPVSDETIDEVIETFSDLGWTRKDYTNIKELKDLMKQNHKTFSYPIIP